MPAAVGPSVGSPIGSAVFGAQAKGPPVSITVTASPFTYLNNTPDIQFISINAPPSATITVSKRGVQISNVITPAATNHSLIVPVGPGESLIVTYTVAPTMQADTP